MKPHDDDPAEWQLRTRNVRLPRSDELPLLMGIVNTTPDSFSDGGLWAQIETAVAHGLSLIESGADILDIGGRAHVLSQTSRCRRGMASSRRSGQDSLT